MSCWLVKSEPDVFSIDDLKRKKKEAWDGVRNYQARNYIRDQMKIGDRVLFYHSNAEPSGVAGICRVASIARPDPSATDPQSKYFDSQCHPDSPRWFVVDMAFVTRFEQLIPLAILRETPGLEGMVLLRKGNRLSVMPVSDQEFEIIQSLGLAQ